MTAFTCKHIYGVGPGYEGDIYWYYDPTSMNPMNDTKFDYCPDCGKKLEEDDD